MGSLVSHVSTWVSEFICALHWVYMYVCVCEFVHSCVCSHFVYLVYILHAWVIRVCFVHAST